MRLAIFSDVHGNRHSLDAVLADVGRQSPDAVYCLGDLVGYGAFPNEVTERVSGAGYLTVMGTTTMALDSIGMSAAAPTRKNAIERSAIARSRGRKSERPLPTRPFCEGCTPRSGSRPTANASCSYTAARAR